MHSQNLFIKHHWAQSITALVVVIFVISFQVIIEDTSLFKPSEKGVVKGESIAVEPAEPSNEIVLAYQAKIKNIVRQFMDSRSDFTSPGQDWIFLINSNKNKLLSMDVPIAYQDLHLKLVNALDFEKQAIFEADQSKIDQSNQSWQQLLEQYYWLNY